MGRVVTLTLTLSLKGEGIFSLTGGSYKIDTGSNVSGPLTAGSELRYSLITPSHRKTRA